MTTKKKKAAKRGAMQLDEIRLTPTKRKQLLQILPRKFFSAMSEDFSMRQSSDFYYGMIAGIEALYRAGKRVKGSVFSSFLLEKLQLQGTIVKVIDISEKKTKRTVKKSTK